MTTKNILATAAGTLFLLGLAACGDGDGSIGGGNGGGGGGGSGTVTNPSSPSRFTSTDQVAQVASATNGALGIFGLNQTGGLGKSSASASTSTSAPVAVAQAKAGQANAAQACNGGGTRDFIDDTTTAYGSDGTVVYAKCQITSTSSGTTTGSLTDGKIASRCTDAAQTANSCTAATTRFADGVNGSTDYTRNATERSSSTNEDFSLAVRGDLTDSSTDTTGTTTISVALSFVDNINKHALSAVFDNLRVVSTRTQTGVAQRIDGAFGIGSNTSQCAIGKVTVATNTPLTYNSNADIVAGKVTLTDSANQSATAEYASDGSVKVTLPNGTTRTYSATELDNFCN